MADILPTAIDIDELRARWGSFAWTAENADKAKTVVGRYPPGRQHSAIIPLLDLAQRQIGAETQTQGWLPVPVIEYVAKYLDMPYIRAYEVATFYTMFNLRPVGRYHVQVCGTTPCMLRGSDDVFAACKAKGLAKGQTTADGLFTLQQSECLGACADSPVMLVNDRTMCSFMSNDKLDQLVEGLRQAEGAGAAVRRTEAP